MGSHYYYTLHVLDVNLFCFVLVRLTNCFMNDRIIFNTNQMLLAFSYPQYRSHQIHGK